MNTITLSIETKRLIGIFILFLLIIFSTAQVQAVNYSCSKCAPGFAYTKAAYKSSTANCNSPVTDITYSCDCSCGSTSATQQSFGNCRSQCANTPTQPAPSPTPQPTGGATTYPCTSKCSSNYDYTKASSYTSTTANCVNPVAGSVTYSCDCSCGANSALHQTYGSCSQQCSTGGTPSPTPVTICETELCGSTGCMVRCCTTTRVGTSSTTNCVSKIGPTPSPTPVISLVPSLTPRVTITSGPSPTGTLNGTVSGTPVPSVTSATSCSCVADSCSSTCVFDVFSDIAYSQPLKCTLPSTVHFSSPDAPLKNQSCTAAKRTKGDADGNGTINMLDYMYFISASFGGKVPPAVNPDFSGDGVVGAADRTIIIKSLPTQ